MFAKADWPKNAYRDGVPTGSDLPPPPGAAKAPSCLGGQRPNSSNLGRIQVVKRWLEKGDYREKVFDAA